MLVLTRRPGERLLVGEATVTVLASSRGQVRLGVDAPAHVPILREELRRRLDTEPVRNPRLR